MAQSNHCSARRTLKEDSGGVRQVTAAAIQEPQSDFVYATGAEAGLSSRNEVYVDIGVHVNDSGNVDVFPHFMAGPALANICHKERVNLSF